MASVHNDVRPPSRDVRFTIRLDAGELEDLRQRASRLGVSASALARASIMDAVRGEGSTHTSVSAVQAPAHDPRELVDLRVAVTRVGVNINQIARKLNSDESLIIGGGSSHDDVLETLQQCRDALQQVQAALGGTIPGRPLRPAP